eukprot:8879967-Pyramimonas_sp.AAC.1
MHLVHPCSWLECVKPMCAARTRRPHVGNHPKMSASVEHNQCSIDGRQWAATWRALGIPT